jgi:starch synthase
LNILFLSSEAVPFAKTGGLGDVSGILPKVLAKSENVFLMIPAYGTAEIASVQTTPVDDFAVVIGGVSYPAAIKKTIISGNFSVFFVENDSFFNREFLYGDPSGDYPDNFIRFLFFQKAALEFVRRQGLHVDIIHCNDWQTALAPLYVKLEPPASALAGCRVVFSIHNLGYQGIFPAGHFAACGLPADLFTSEYLEFYGKLNCLKAGIVFSDRLVTVSPTYAKEILQAESGFGLDGLLRKFSPKLVGILNGVDYSTWDPEVDPFIAHRYSLNSLENKKENKKELLDELGLFPGDRAPLIIMISRISEQKGVALLLTMLPLLLREDVRFVFLGMGDLSWTDEMKNMAARFPGKMSFLNRFDERMAHRLEAAADILLMPSVYEPCGLNQIYSMKYGTVPVVRATGGLADSVQEFDPRSGSGTGFRFSGSDADEAMAALGRVFHFFANAGQWRKIQQNGMSMDFSWERVAPRYLELYKNILTEEKRHG